MRTNDRPHPDPRPRRAARATLLTPLVCVLMARALGAGAAGPVALAGEPGRATGSISGHVVLGPKLASRQVRFHLYPDAVTADTKRKPPVAGNELRNVVVYVEYAPHAGAAPPPGPPPSIRQEDLTFVPHVLAITKGTEVEFPNTDPVFHNVFSLSRAESFDLGRYPKGASKRIRFDSAGIVKVFCHIHSDMSAVVVVLDNPYFASPDGDGSYVIDGLPPGDYKVTGWHERAHPVTLHVHVDPGKTSPADFNIPLVDDNGG